MSSNNTMQLQNDGGNVKIVTHASHSTKTVSALLRVKMKNGKMVYNWPFTTEKPATEESQKLARRVYGGDADAADFATVKGIYIYDQEGHNATFVADEQNATHEMFISRRGVNAYAGINNFDLIEVGDYKIVAIPIGRVETATIYGRDY